MAETLFLVGGPKHGTRTRVNDARHSLMMAEMTGHPRWLDNFDPAFMSPTRHAESMGYATVRYELVKLPIGHRFIMVAVHPDITHETAQRYVSDLVMAAWERQ